MVYLLQYYSTRAIVCVYLYNKIGLGASIQWIPRQNLPVIKHTLWECLSTCIAAQICCEA
jgi:hypothetical protein